MVTCLMSRLYRCFVYVMQNRTICALPFDWDCMFLCGACDSFVASVTRPSLSNY